MSDTVSIRITADTSGIEAGIQEVRGDLGALKSTVQGAADSMSQGFAGVRGAVAGCGGPVALGDVDDVAAGGGHHRCESLLTLSSREP